MVNGNETELTATLAAVDAGQDGIVGAGVVCQNADASGPMAFVAFLAYICKLRSNVSVLNDFSNILKKKLL